MLNLRRKAGETIEVFGRLTIKVYRVRGTYANLAIEGPAMVLRGEIAERYAAERGCSIDDLGGEAERIVIDAIRERATDPEMNDRERVAAILDLCDGVLSLPKP